MFPLGAIVDPGFQVKGLNLTGITQPTDAQRDNFSSEATLDTTIGSTHATKDKPYLTMNDKVYAARIATGTVVTPVDIPLVVVPPLPEPTNSNSKEEIRAWLEEHGVEYTDMAFSKMTKSELLSVVEDLLDNQP